MLWFFGVEVPMYIEIVVTTLAITWPFAGFTIWWFFRRISLTDHPQSYADTPFAMHLFVCVSCTVFGWLIYAVFLASDARADLRRIHDKARPE
ncbi:hypothetical protein A3D71_00835 [Candidatus Kaiserbacteria bacterium RIFCSPHIGHO2_02_FULL_55_20]|uniref:Uncharacterized protein n=1 Tax=Candidatus Kaiserbacteria bacterium RIFCSPHIGHO2_02_FULL_55_20 TaxID=1798497 RepID=A0A1F6DWE6_9BACT|nr:MAG: hypothetical protein A2680_02525 [Candidatus Kaiserbacteria bacterium RIFCSPHIGHO2_01_FULL_55_37]OGG65706.1 MAG: hypothetical protein A3D71_00835 [Candidatus Kaiserbacteria bacterium RIFCSPHIGHO2_02_FULL_55_20]